MKLPLDFARLKNIRRRSIMPRLFIRNADAPASPLFSQAVRVGNFIWISGTAGIDPATQKIAGPTIREQTRQAILNCRNILSAAGATLADVVEVQALMANPADFQRSLCALLHCRPAGSLRCPPGTRAARHPRVDSNDGDARGVTG
jgi:enamine deaminase RidA (YjgF/YER057c/UK114 family)